MKSATAPGWVSHAGWVSDHHLVILTWLPRDASEHPVVILGGRSADAVSTLVYGDSDPAAGGAPTMLVAVFASGASPRGAMSLRLAAGGADLHADGVGISALDELVREGLAWLEAGERARVAAHLVAATADRPGRALSDGLHQVREALRERQPAAALDPARRQALHVDALFALGPSSFYIEGWVLSHEAPMDRLTAVSPEGERVELRDRIFRYERPDITAFAASGGREAPARAGFVAFFETEHASHRPAGWIVEMVDAMGVGLEASAPVAIIDPAAARATLLTDLALERLPGEELRTRHLRPALTRLLDRTVRAASLDRVIELGHAPEEPEVTVVIPLYGRTDFVENHMAEFVHDPEMARADIVYVLDSPELADGLEVHAHELSRLYGLPFRIAVLAANGGFANANNIGAGLARGRLLLLMNSDVVPSRPGWLGEMASFIDANPKVGALAPKLLYEDGSIQHAGLYFDRPPGSTLWSNEHFLKGLHGDIAAARVTRRVPAVTAACLMTPRDLYERLGGLRNLFVRGDYEDSDFCLRLLDEGFESWYLAEVELFHLEGQSYPSAIRRDTSAYNKWLHTFLWRRRLEDDWTGSR